VADSRVVGQTPEWPFAARWITSERAVRSGPIGKRWATGQEPFPGTPFGEHPGDTFG
jgi:hypothetical protein